MLQIIGLMVGLYIATRMIETVTTKGVHWAVAVFAIVTLLATGYGVLELSLTGSYQAAVDAAKAAQ